MYRISEEYKVKRQISTGPGTQRFRVWSLRGPRAFFFAFGALIFVCAQLTSAQPPDVPGSPGANKHVLDLPYKQGELIVRFADTGPEAPIRKVITGPLTNRAVKNILSNMAFPGAVVHKETDQLNLYYGAADCTVAVATAQLSSILDYIMSCPTAE